MSMRRFAVLIVAFSLTGAAAEPVLKWKYETRGKIYASPLIADLDQDGTFEVIVAASRDRRLICLDSNGQLRWEVEINDGHADGLQATPSICDYNGDGKLEVFVVSKGGTVACIAHDGTLRWQVALGDQVDYSAPVLADINANGRLEIIIGSESGTLYCLDDTGARLWHYQGQGEIRGIPAIGRDPNGATLRIYAAFSGGMLGCFDSEGNLVWAQHEPGPRAERRSGVAVGDLNGDGREEVVSATEDFTVIVSDAATGEERWRWKGAHAIDQTNSFALADMDGSGRLDILCGDGLGLSRPGNLYRLRDGNALWTADVGGGVLHGPSVGDVDGDGELDVLVSSRSGRLICLSADGTEKWHYETEAGCLTTPAIGDVDGDGQTDIIFTSKDRFVYCVSVGGAHDASRVPWPNINGDLQLTGNAAPPAFAAPRAAPPRQDRSPLGFDSLLRDDLLTADISVRVANPASWPRRMQVTAELTDAGQKKIYTDTKRYEAQEMRELRFPVQTLTDGPIDVKISLTDLGTSREIGSAGGSVQVDNTGRLEQMRQTLEDGLQTLLATVTVDDTVARARAAHDPVAQALTAAAARVGNAPAAEAAQRKEALIEAAAAMREARRWLARAAAIGSAGEDFAVVADTSLRKIFRDEPYEDGTPAAAIHLARNESEAFQLVVVPLWRELRGVKISAGDLLTTAGGGRIAAENISIAPVGYVEIGTPEYSFPVEKIGAWPDILLPDEPVTIPAHQDAQPFWVTVTTKPDTPPGAYRGTLRVEADGCDAVEVPFEVEVWDFALPDHTTLKTSFWMNEGQIARFYGYDGRLPWELRKQWYDIHLDRRVSPIKDFPLGGGNMVEDFDYLMSHGQNTFFVPVPHVTDEAQLPELAEKFAATHAILDAKGWSDDALLYTWDEVAVVGRHTIPQFVKMNAWLQEAAPWWPRLQTSAPEQALIGTTDVWCPTIDHFDPVLLADRMAQGERLWLYTVWERPGIMIEFPATDHRLMFWECWKYGAEGFLYWGTTHYGYNLHGDQRWPDVPWIPWNSQPGHHGCGYLVYPGPGGRPLSSIRLELVRDGIEDYETLHMLKQLVEEAGDALPAPLRARAARELAVDPAVVADQSHFTESAQVLLDARARIATCILEIQEWMAGSP
jgi:outer membrane protein assembly factor BamB